MFVKERIFGHGKRVVVVAAEREKALFLQKLNSNTTAHAYIVEGAEGIGKKEFALWCASALLCEGTDKPCGVCPACKKILDGFHPDVHLYGDDGKTVSIGDVRGLIHETGMVPVDGERMVFILCGAGKMQAPAQNALLKIFEEPPAGVVIFLLTDSMRSLLPTVRSRGQKIKLSGMSEEELLSELKRKYPKTADGELREAAKAAGGSIGSAETFLRKDAERDREKAEEWIAAAFAGDKYRLVSLIATPKYKREQLLPLLDAFLRRLFDLLLTKSDVLPCRDEDTDVRASRHALAGMCEATVRCRESIENNGNITAVMTAFATELWHRAG